MSGLVGDPSSNITLPDRKIGLPKLGVLLYVPVPMPVGLGLGKVPREPAAALPEVAEPVPPEVPAAF
jgi:hypothetical protein